MKCHVRFQRQAAAPGIGSSPLQATTQHTAPQVCVNSKTHTPRDNTPALHTKQELSCLQEKRFWLLFPGSLPAAAQISSSSNGGRGEAPNLQLAAAPLLPTRSKTSKAALCSPDPASAPKAYTGRDHCPKCCRCCFCPHFTSTAPDERPTLTTTSVTTAQ